ncbi:MAG: EamA family transporter [Chitinivibrionales bacterium]|nr:EamA family transporter [Chitinivibrionales bacterium]MBD3357322.1 EamA family transporter [Chitinivibrionales bacterium]
MTWVLLSLASAVFVAARYLYIKRFCRGVGSGAVVFVTRAVGSLVLLPPTLGKSIYIGSPAVFWPILLLTAVLTMAATIATMRIVQRDPLSGSIPYLSFIPIFMVPWTLLFFKEMPSTPAFAGVVLTCAGAYLLNIRAGMSFWEPFRIIAAHRVPRYMLPVAVVLGLTTACDRIAIASSTALSYTFLWTAVSALLTGITVAKHNGTGTLISSLKNPHVVAQAVIWAGGFYGQMAAVQAALPIDSGVTYVKTLTMTSILFTVIGGGALLKERGPLRGILASALMVGGAILVVVAR